MKKISAPAPFGPVFERIRKNKQIAGYTKALGMTNLEIDLKPISAGQIIRVIRIINDMTDTGIVVALTPNPRDFSVEDRNIFRELYT